MISESIVSFHHDVAVFGFVQPGYQEMLIIGIIALLLFGKRLPEVARNLGKGFSEFKKGISEFHDEVRTGSSPPPRRLDYSDSTKSTADSRPVAKDPATDAENDDEFTAPKFEIQDH